MAGEAQPGGERPNPEPLAPDRWLERAGQLGLSPRQLLLARAICLGHGDDEIASRLAIPPDALGTHLAGLFDKLKVEDRIGAISRLLQGEPGEASR